MEEKFIVYYAGNRKGPFTIEELKQFKIQRYDLIWQENTSTWIEAHKVEALKSLFDDFLPAPRKENLPEVDKKVMYSNSNIGNIEFLSNRTVKIYYPNYIVHYRYASFIERLLARIIDIFIIIIPAAIIPILPAWLYFSLMHCSTDQQTLGQKVFNIKLESADGKKVTFGQSTGRFFANILNALTFLIGYLMFFFNSKNQCLHDMLADTIVVSEIGREKR
ncbi:RDD family protein [Chryseobacterium sp. RR2-3-20]|uniref:RDD family protein n=1 Tax=Chryseobacterium sp. RR2-3-20 TaxID=2787626 RepID=UPI001ADF298B|nr:RDD family protein [Chryseobacterium sp. RR2-3-20]